MRHLHVVLALVCASGCDHVFGLERDDAAISEDGAPLDALDPCFDRTQLTHDEDADGIKDGCDVCPADANPGQEDRDHDGVGDLCDPHPDDPRDHIALFEGFNAIDPRWEVAGGVWSTGGGALVQSVKAYGMAYLRTAAFANASAEIKLATGPTASASGAVIGVVVRVPVGANGPTANGYLCDDNLNAASVHSFVVADMPAMTANDGAPFGAALPATLLVTSTGDCYGTAGADVRQRITLTKVFPLLGGGVALYTGGTPATFNSLTVIETSL